MESCFISAQTVRLSNGASITRTYQVGCTGGCIFFYIEFTLHHRPGTLNVVAHALPRLPAEAPDPPRAFKDTSKDLTSTLHVRKTCMDSHRCARIRKSAFNRDKIIRELGVSVHVIKARCWP